LFLLFAPLPFPLALAFALPLLFLLALFALALSVVHCGPSSHLINFEIRPSSPRFCGEDSSSGLVV